jgi:hypothetical protein
LLVKIIGAFVSDWKMAKFQALKSPGIVRPEGVPSEQRRSSHRALASQPAA